MPASDGALLTPRTCDSFKPGKVYWISKSLSCAQASRNCVNSQLTEATSARSRRCVLSHVCVTVYIVLRKFAIAFSALMFRGSPGFQLAMILLVLFVCFVAQVQNRPYMSTAERDLVLHEHRIKALEGDTTHEAIEDVISMGIRKIDAEKEKKARMQNRRMSFVFQGVDVKMDDVEQVRDYFWDYNTVEMVLLACSILVCLAGVMFESDRFNAGRKDLDFQRLMITFGVMGVVGFSMFCK